MLTMNTHKNSKRWNKTSHNFSLAFVLHCLVLLLFLGHFYERINGWNWTNRSLIRLGHHFPNEDIGEWLSHLTHTERDWNRSRSQTRSGTSYLVRKNYKLLQTSHTSFIAYLHISGMTDHYIKHTHDEW